MKKIYVITPFHTGTWFCLKLICDHPGVTGFMRIPFLKQVLLNKKSKRHTLTPDGKAFIDEELRDNEGYVVLHNHILVDMPLIEAILLSDRTIVTIRDPLLTLMTRKARSKPEYDEPLKLYIDQYLYIARLIKVMEPCQMPFIFPVDLFETREERYFSVFKLLSYCNLEPCPHAAKWAEMWPTNYNSMGEYESKKYYRLKDLTYFEKNFKEEMALLYKHEIELKHFLKSIGYKNLFWWN